MTLVLSHSDKCLASLPKINKGFKVKEKRELGKGIIYVRDLKSHDPYGMYIDPRRNSNKQYKKYTQCMLINTQLCSVLDEEKRYCFI